MCGKFGLVTFHPALSIAFDLPFCLCYQQHVSERFYTSTPFSVVWSQSAVPGAQRVPREDGLQSKLRRTQRGHSLGKEKSTVQP